LRRAPAAAIADTACGSAGFMTAMSVTEPKLGLRSR
jgi:hypothetical protein